MGGCAGAAADAARRRTHEAVTRVIMERSPSLPGRFRQKPGFRGVLSQAEFWRIATPRPSATPKVSREEIAAIVDRFLANRPDVAPLPAPAESAPRPANGGSAQANVRSQSANGGKAADFVSEDDVKRAIQKGEKIYVGPKTIITPSARDIGDPAEVFAKA